MLGVRVAARLSCLICCSFVVIQTRAKRRTNSVEENRKAWPITDLERPGQSETLKGLAVANHLEGLANQIQFAKLTNFICIGHIIARLYL